MIPLGKTTWCKQNLKREKKDWSNRESVIEKVQRNSLSKGKRLGQKESDREGKSKQRVVKGNYTLYLLCSFTGSLSALSRGETSKSIHR